ncbi:MAG: hypothetical protein A3B70_03220 [Deltaproteobacteria bacterium RIFCSPHIGHO2_02_FULL_40_11]|nr:MAG: hypothetical protein A3B70_03220 [Deltaproteobacteria bacterium RIFCSPHIGHO2_02_FULL_40_11]
MFRRLLSPSNHSSFFLFGARGTGKSTWLKGHFLKENVLYFDLLDPAIENLFLTQPQRFKEQILSALEKQPKLNWIIVDEVQKCPALLNYVHMLIEDKKLKFALSGSSARRLKQKGVNLLAGRAFIEHLFPLTHGELGADFDLKSVLSYGSLPHVFDLHHPQEKKDFLSAYALTYVQNEIQAEQWIRKLTPFRKFLPIAAQMNGKIINYHKIEKDIGVDWSTIKNYFDILEDTLIGFQLEGWHQSVRKRQRQAPKFYFFDIGIKKALEGSLDQIPTPGTGFYGECFEHFIILEIYRLNTLLKKDYKLSYLRTKDDAEIDIILSKPGIPILLIEIKSSSNIIESDITNLSNLARDIPNSKPYVLCQESTPRKMGSVEILPWEQGLKEIGLIQT